MSNVKIAVIYHSKYGHTKAQAEAVYAGVAAVEGVEARLLTTEEAIAAIDSLDSCQAMIFGSPTYMGNMSADMKKFIEASVTKWGKRTWQDKIAGGFTNSANFFGDKFNALVGLMTFAMQQGMIWVGVNDLAGSNERDALKTAQGPGPEALNRVSASIGPIACSFEVKAPDTPPKGDIETARNYGRRIAEITKRFNR